MRLEIGYWFLLLCIFGFFHPCSTLYCFWNAGCYYKYLSTETPYTSVRGDIRDSVIKLTGCEAVSIWGIYRHGKREPSAVFGEPMKNAVAIRDFVVDSYEKHRSSLCAQDVENLRSWNFGSNLFDGKQELTEEGRKEMTGLGKRLKEAFPTLLSNIKKGDYTFRSAKGPWIEKSIKHFVSGLGNKNLVIDEVKNGADVMAPYATCDKTKTKLQSNINVYAEAEKFLNTTDYLALKDRIQRRTGIDYTLTDVNITALYDLCRYTWSAVDNKASPWCALFTTEDLKILEYIQDLKHYYRNGYGTPNNEIVGRVPLADLYQSFENVKNGMDKKIVSYVTDAAMLDQIYTALGLFKDKKFLTGANRDPERKWRTSKISVFSANLVAVLYRCNNGNSFEYNVIFYLNEEPIMTICEEGVCSWQEFENKLRPFINTKIDFCELESETY